jgi:hypothetical protein
VGVYVGSGIGSFEVIEREHSKLNAHGPDRVSPFFITASIVNLALNDIAASEGVWRVWLRDEFREAQVTTPPLPRGFVQRSEELTKLRAALMADSGTRTIAITAVEGMAGIGKTALAQTLCHDIIVQTAFPDGIVWVTAGRESSRDALVRLREVGKVLNAASWLTHRSTAAPLLTREADHPALMPEGAPRRGS